MGDMLETAAMQSGLNTFTGAANGLFGLISAGKIAKLNYGYGEKAAQNADARRRALYEDYESPMATIRQLKEAGLSPSIYASGGINGTIGSTAGAMGGGAAGMSMPSAMIPATDLAQVKVADAQARYLNAEADELEGKNPMGEAKIADLLAAAGLKKAQEAYTNAETTFQNIENYISNETKEFSIAKLKHNAAEAEANANKAFWEVENSQLEWSWNVETFEKRKEQLSNEVAELADRAAYERSGKRLNDAEKNAVASYAKAAIDNASAHKDSATAYGEYVDLLKDQMPKELDLEKDKLNLQKWELGVNAVKDVLIGGMHMIGMNMFASGRSEKLVEHFDSNRHLTGGTKTQTRRAGGKK